MSTDTETVTAATQPVMQPLDGETDEIEMSEEEARELERALEELNRAALEMVERLDRVHLIMRDIKNDLRAARGLPPAEETNRAAA